MPRPSLNANRRKVKRTVVYYVAATRKRRPAKITALSSNGGAVLKVTGSNQVFGNASTGILQRTTRTATNVWDVS